MRVTDLITGEALGEDTDPIYFDPVINQTIAKRVVEGIRVTDENGVVTDEVTVKNIDGEWVKLPKALYGHYAILELGTSSNPPQSLTERP